MSVEKVGYSQQPNVITIEHRPCTDISDLWLVKDITAPTGDESWTAQEAYMQIPTIECPSRETVEEDFDSWFARASKWPVLVGDHPSLDEIAQGLSEAMQAIMILSIA